jgi:uncharacterized membrane protein
MKNEATTNALEATVASLANKATYTGAGVTISGGILISEIAVIVGMVIGVLGLLVNWYYRAKDDRRAVIEHKRRMGERE